MNEFPFDAAEWSKVKQAATLVTNAVAYWDDAELAASARGQLFSHLAELACKYGQHPVLIETRADFEEDCRQQVKLYLRAIELAESHRLPTLSIRLSLTEIYIESADHLNARLQLQQYANDAKASGDGFEFEEWRQASLRCGLV